MQGVNVDTAAASFWAAHPPSSVRTSVSQSLQQSRPRTPHTPHASSNITPSEHRPPVLASDHLLLWSTPAGQDWQSVLEQTYPDSFLFRLFQVMVRSLDTNTRSNYGAGLLRCTQFCNSIHIPKSKCMPAAKPLLSQFAAAFAGTMSEKTLNNWLAGLQFWHVINGAQWHRSQLLHHTRHGFSKMVPPSSCWAKQPPVTIDALCILHDHLDLSDLFDAAVGAIALVSFWCCCWLGEVVIPSINVANPLKHFTWAILPLVILTVCEDVQATVLHIPWSKTMQECGVDILVTSRMHRTCPLIAIERHLLVNNDLPSHAPFFSFHTSSGWSPMTRTAFLAHCNTIWTAQGFPDLPGHTFQIGGAMELLLQGIHPDIMSTQGRWSSDAFLEYWRHIDTILPLFIALTANTERLLELDRVMDLFACHHHLSCVAPSI
ncbi:hypothetical protein BDR03DRAFT_856189 [Suillus americanus]|nr:hypothetical protein BDR03DRAFT_856189 [Suillus americanus]